MLKWIRLQEPDFGIWDEDYLCIVNFEKDEVKGVKLTSRKQDIAEAVKWKSQILKKSVKINSEKDVEDFKKKYS